MAALVPVVLAKVDAGSEKTDQGDKTTEGVKVEEVEQKEKIKPTTAQIKAAKKKKEMREQAAKDLDAEY
jgi:hypothetical protein